MKLFNLTLALVLATSTAKAGEALDQAREAVEAQRAFAKSQALKAIEGDYNYAISQVMTNLQPKADSQAVIGALLERQSRLFTELKSIESLDQNQVAKVKADALAALERYKEVTREKFDLSFQAEAIRQGQRDSIRLAISALQQFNANCSSGRGIGGLGASAFQYPDLPRADIGFYVGTQGADFHYNGNGTDAEKNRNTAVSISGTVAGSVAAVAYIPATITGASASSVVLCAAAAPYTLGAGVAIAAAVAYINHAERVERENDIARAKAYAFDYNPNDRTIAGYYRNQCSSKSETNEKLIQYLRLAVDSPDSLEDFAGGVDFVEDTKKLDALAQERYNLRNQIKALDSKKDSAAIQSLATKLIEIESQIAAITTPQHVGAMMISVLIDQRDQLTQDLSQTASSSLDFAQKRAFERILAIINLTAQREFSKFLSGSDEIAREIKVSKQFADAQMLLKKTIAAQIKAIFGYLTKADVAKIQDELLKATRALIKAYPRAADVKSFASQVSQLSGGL